MVTSIVICRNCNEPYIDDIIPADQYTTCPTCDKKVNLFKYTIRIIQVKDAKRLVY